MVLKGKDRCCCTHYSYTFLNYVQLSNLRKVLKKCQDEGLQVCQNNFGQMQQREWLLGRLEQARAQRRQNREIQARRLSAAASDAVDRTAQMAGAAIGAAVGTAARGVGSLAGGVFEGASAAWGATILYFTGPADFNIKYRWMAKRKGLKLSEYGLFDRNTDQYLAGATEADIFTALGRPYKDPAQRQGFSKSKKKKVSNKKHQKIIF